MIDPTTPTTLYVALYMSGIFKSTDGGESWTAVNRGLPLYFEARVEATSLYVTDVVIDPTTPTILYAQVFSNSGEGVYKSTDGGATWVSSHVGVYSFALVTVKSNENADPDVSSSMMEAASGTGGTMRWRAFSCFPLALGGLCLLFLSLSERSQGQPFPANCPGLARAGTSGDCLPLCS